MSKKKIMSSKNKKRSIMSRPQKIKRKKKGNFTAQKWKKKEEE